METNNDIVIYSGENRSRRAQACAVIWTRKSIKNTIINYTYWSERIIEVKQYRKREIIIFGLYAREEGNIEESENFYNILQKILNKSS